MKKLALLLYLGIFNFSTYYAQETSRTQIQGTIQMPAEDEEQGISIFNLQTNRGTVSNAQGNFNLEVAVNDSLRVSAVQFNAFTVVINEGVIESGRLNINVTEVVNELPDVVVSPYELTGNVNVDITRLQVLQAPDTLNAFQVQNMYFEADDAANLQAPPRNTAINMGNTRMVNGLNFVNLFKEVLIAGKREQVQRPSANINADVRTLYSDEFFQENFDIKMENIPDFIQYADENGLEERMLKEGNEMDLLDFLVEQSKKYKKQQGRN